MGIPPPADSNLTHGRRKFLGKKKNEDRLGIPRLVSNNSRTSKTKAPSSKAKEPPKKAPKSKKKALAESSSGENLQPGSDDDMYISDGPKLKKVRDTTENLEIPSFSNSPRATRSMRGKRDPEPLADRVEGKRRKVSNKG